MNQVTVFSTVADSIASKDPVKYFSGFDLVPISHMAPWNEHVIRYNGLDPRGYTEKIDNPDTNQPKTLRPEGKILWWRSPWYTRKY